MEVDAVESRKEVGCLRFDLLRDNDKPNTFVFYEAYTSSEALAHHKTLPHYLGWADFKAKGGVISQTAAKNTPISWQKNIIS